MMGIAVTRQSPKTCTVRRHGVVGILGVHKLGTEMVFVRV